MGFLNMLTYLQTSQDKQPSTSKFQESGGEESEHDYCLKRKIKSTEFKNKIKKRRVMRKQNVPRISTNIENITAESINILKNIEQNTARIADSFEKLVSVFVSME